MHLHSSSKSPAVIVQLVPTTVNISNYKEVRVSFSSTLQLYNGTVSHFAFLVGRYHLLPHLGFT